MADVINLRTVRKAKERDNAQKTASANRAKFGMTKAEKLRLAAEQKRLDAVVDGARRQTENKDAE